LLWLSLPSALGACQQAPKSEPAPAASTKTALAPAPAPAAPAKAWFEGAWQGAFVAELQRIELPVGNVKEWKLDDGKLASGDGKLALRVSSDGVVSGSASGALGDLAVTGRVEGDRAALSLFSARPEGFHGVVLAMQSGDGMKGTLSASSADSLQVRKAEVTLTRATK
jgi:hypothetical protein